MTVYIDVLIVVNFYITYFVLRASAGLLHTRLKMGRLIAAAVIGGISSAAAVFAFPFWAAIPLRCALTVLPVITAFGFSGIKPLLLQSFVSFAVSLLLCGVVIGLRELTGNSFFAEVGGFVYLNVSVLTLIISTTAAYLLLSLFRRILDKPCSDGSVPLEIKNNGKTVRLNAFLDSVNTLRDFFTGLPVIVCRLSSVSGLAPPGIERAQSDPPAGVRLIPYSTIDGSGIIAAFRADEVTVGGKDVDVLIGVSDTAMKNEEFEAVFNPKILI